jgi:hypothetical protein
MLPRPPVLEHAAVAATAKTVMPRAAALRIEIMLPSSEMPGSIKAILVPFTPSFCANQPTPGRNFLEVG